MFFFWHQLNQTSNTHKHFSAKSEVTGMKISTTMSEAMLFFSEKGGIIPSGARRNLTHV